MIVYIGISYLMGKNEFHENIKFSSANIMCRVKLFFGTFIDES